MQGCAEAGACCHVPQPHSTLPIAACLRPLVRGFASDRRAAAAARLQPNFGRADARGLRMCPAVDKRFPTGHTAGSSRAGEGALRRAPTAPPPPWQEPLLGRRADAAAGAGRVGARGGGGGGSAGSVPCRVPQQHQEGGAPRAARGEETARRGPASSKCRLLGQPCPPRVRHQQ